MTLFPKMSHFVFVVVIAISAARLTAAQSQLEWLPHGLDAVRQHASSKTEFTLDHSMLVMASKLDPDNEDLRRVIAGVSGVSVHRYQFPATWTHDPQILSSMKDEYHVAGWKQVVDHAKDAGSETTDIWVRLENNAISNIALLMTKAHEVDFIVVSGSISPLDLTHLAGHFGIPKIEGGVVVPNTTRRP
ncbi:MAG: DUF4252 domain-containing protein [Terriglobales bacterium]